MTAAPPRVAIAMVIGASRDRAAANLSAICSQDRIGECEVLVVDLDSGAEPIAVPDSVPVRWIDHRGGEFGPGRALAARAASAPLVAYLEDHCRPEPGWLSGLIEARDANPQAGAIGYAFATDPGDSWAGKATLLAEYGEWVEPAPGGPTRTLPGNNVSYDRELLAELDREPGELDRYLSIDALLHNELIRRGRPMVVAPAARVLHTSLPTLRTSMEANNRYSRLLAAIQVELEGWSWPRRIGWAVAAPLGAPALRLVRLARRIGGRRLLHPSVTALLPGAFAIYFAASAGQSLGYLAGRGESAAELARWELEVERLTASTPTGPDR